MRGIVLSFFESPDTYCLCSMHETPRTCIDEDMTMEADGHEDITLRVSK